MRKEGYRSGLNIYICTQFSVLSLVLFAPKSVVPFHRNKQHARRKFEEALKEDRPRAEYALLLMRELYEIERQMQEEELSFADIEKFRKEKSYPILQKLEQWLLDNKGKVLPKGLISKAISYTYDIFPRLARYVINGRYKIDNNGAENGIRPMALGRKNYLFCGNDDAAKKAAIVYSLLGSCKLANVNPMAWLTDILTRLPDHSANKLTELLPKNWSPITQPNSYKNTPPPAIPQCTTHVAEWLQFKFFDVPIFRIYCLLPSFLLLPLCRLSKTFVCCRYICINQITTLIFQGC